MVADLDVHKDSVYLCIMCIMKTLICVYLLFHYILSQKVY